MASEIIKHGKYVTLTYSIADQEGKILEQSDIPMSYVYGGDTELLGGVDHAILGKQAGDTVKVTVPPEKGFGEHDPELTFTDNVENVPPQFRHVGAEVEMRNETGESKTFFVTRIEDGMLTIDGNHPMAGKTLTVNLKILEVRAATPEDALNSGIHSVTPGAPH